MTGPAREHGQPDGSGHQFTLTDRRQATDPRNPGSILDNQDKAKIARYDSYLKFAYRTADRAVERIAEAAGSDANVFQWSEAVVPRPRLFGGWIRI